MRSTGAAQPHTMTSVCLITSRGNHCLVQLSSLPTSGMVKGDQSGTHTLNIFPRFPHGVRIHGCAHLLKPQKEKELVLVQPGRGPAETALCVAGAGLGHLARVGPGTKRDINEVGEKLWRITTGQEHGLHLSTTPTHHGNGTAEAWETLQHPVCPPLPLFFPCGIVPCEH